MKIVVTGGTGFLGSQLVAHLQRLNYQVEVVSRTRGHDIRDPGTLKDVFEGSSVVFHLAALVQSRPGPFEETNVAGLRNVLEAVARAGVERFVYVSSFTIFGPSAGKPHQEIDLPARTRFFHGYDRTKYEAFQLARDWSSRISINSVFPGVIYGPGKLTEGNILVRMFQRWAATRLAPLPVGGRPCWNFVHVEDVVNGLAKVWRDGGPGRDYILGGPNVTLTEMCETFRAVSGRTILKVPVPAPAFKLSAYLEDWMSRVFGFPPLVTPSTSAFFLEDWTFSSQRASDETGYSFRSLEDGLRNTYAWMQETAMV